MKQHIINKYGEQEASSRIVAITDKAKGALKQLANVKGYKTYIVPDDVGGRFSVLTPVGLLPIAMAGIDIRALIKGAVEIEKLCKSNPTLNGNLVSEYAVVRHIMYELGKTNEIMVNYEPRLVYFNSMAKAMARTTRASSPLRSLSAPTCTPWANISRTACATCLRR